MTEQGENIVHEYTEKDVLKRLSYRINNKKLTMWNNKFDRETTWKMIVNALEKTSDKECSRCKNKGECAIYDNFNIDYCSDWSEEE